MKDVLGIILKERNYGESSKILDVFTKEYGIIGVISKGSKKIKSTLSGVSTKMTYGVFHIYYKENKLSTLTGVDIINPFKNPTTAPITKATIIAIIMLVPDTNILAQTAPLIASIEPTDKSIPPVSINVKLLPLQLASP